MDNAARGRLGGLARTAKLTPEQRSESARKAVRARWAKRSPALPPTTCTGTSPAIQVISVTLTYMGAHRKRKGRGDA